MPYFLDVDVTKLPLKFPKPCAYCDGAREASTESQQDFSTIKPGLLGAGSLTVKLTMAACPACARWFKRTRIATYALGTIAVTGLLWSVLLAMGYGLVDLAMSAWGASVLGWLGLLLWRRFRRRALDVAYVSDTVLTLRVRRESYARELAALNGLVCVKRLFLVRVQ